MPQRPAWSGGACARRCRMPRPLWSNVLCAICSRSPRRRTPLRRRGAARGRSLRRRFYATAADGDRGSAGYAVALDGKPVRTPARHVARGADAGAGAGDRRRMGRAARRIDPAKMPLTRLANAIIDGVARPGPARSRPRSRNISPPICLLSRRRAAGAWSNARRRTGIRSWPGRATCLAHAFSLGEGVVHVAQPEAALAAARRRPSRPIRGGLAPCMRVTTLTGSALHRARSRARRAVGRCGVAGCPCRRGLEHGAMGPGRSGA